MTELQSKEIEILKYFIDVCEKLNLKYYLVCGSALGAVKYQGFIPWDDDIDVAMPREDYQVFIRHAQDMLPENVFVQTYQTEKYFPQIYCKLRDSNTTYVEKTAQNLPINHGIFIDVFPLDGYPKGRVCQSIFEFRKRIYQSQILSLYEFERKGKSKFIQSFHRITRVKKRVTEIARDYEKMISKYPLKDSKFWCNHGNWQGQLEYAPWEQYSEGVEGCFEGMKVRIPKLYDEYLTQKYGDWRKELPEEEQTGHHECVMCDVTAVLYRKQ